MSRTTDADAAKPRLALVVATTLGLGYLPKAPGTWGSLAGLALAWLFGRAEFRTIDLGVIEFQPFNPLVWWVVVSGIWRTSLYEARAGDG